MSVRYNCGTEEEIPHNLDGTKIFRGLVNYENLFVGVGLIDDDVHAYYVFLSGLKKVLEKCPIQSLKVFDTFYAQGRDLLG